MRRHLPNLVTGLRGLLVAPLFYSVAAGHRWFSLTLVGLALASDAFDGALARRLGASSPEGALFDCFTDFLVVLAAFAGFTVLGLYDAWLLGFIVLMFTQFAYTSLRGVLVYDPFGKAYGFTVLLTVGATLLLGYGPVQAVAPVFLVSFGLLSVATRWRCILGGGEGLRSIRISSTVIHEDSPDQQA